MSRTSARLQDLYRRLDRFYGDQHWWPGETPFEVAVGAILTQNTAWVNVERAIANLKAADALTPDALRRLPADRLAALIRPSGYYNVKARRLRSFLKFLWDEYGGDVAAMAATPVETLREKLLTVGGIGPETADSIVLYACGLPTFVVDAYTRRVLLRHGLADEDAGYDDLKELFEANLPADVPTYNQYHALFVRVGKERCRPREPRCDGCPLEPLLSGGND
jgi:endonuclease-3 related protein